MSVSEWSEWVALFEMDTDGNSHMYHLSLMEACKHESMEIWKHESMEAWKHGSMEAWKQESMEQNYKESHDHRQNLVTIFASQTSNCL